MGRIIITSVFFVAVAVALFYCCGHIIIVDGGRSCVQRVLDTLVVSRIQHLANGEGQYPFHIARASARFILREPRVDTEVAAP